ncbi:hypothetical protein ACOME3_005729 [Neoechinorhynchus agilis]
MRFLKLVLTFKVFCSPDSRTLTRERLNYRKNNTEIEMARKNFFLVDLAGNERGRDNTNRDDTSWCECAQINQSLMQLRECIRALILNQNLPPSASHKIHIPFRSTVLTHILREGLIGANSAVCMIATLSPAQFDAENSNNTLIYADRVKDLKLSKEFRCVAHSMAEELKKPSQVSKQKHHVKSSNGFDCVDYKESEGVANSLLTSEQLSLHHPSLAKLKENIAAWIGEIKKVELNPMEYSKEDVVNMVEKIHRDLSDLSQNE